MTRYCERCEDDGYVEILDDDGFPIGGRECPDLHASWHRPFNASGIFGPSPDPSTGPVYTPDFDA